MYLIFLLWILSFRGMEKFEGDFYILGGRWYVFRDDVIWSQMVVDNLDVGFN